MRPSHIIIHHSLTEDGETVSWGAIRKYHIEVNGWRDIGYQLGIENINGQYEILMGRMLNERGAHCKEMLMNNQSIGICVVGNFDLAPPCLRQMNKLYELCRSLMQVFNIPKDNVKRHSDYATYKSCPGKLFPWSSFISNL